MTEHSLWVFAHILLFVYWLGADLGVFLLSRAAARNTLSFAERAFALKTAVVIDTMPRLCFALMFPVGLHVSDSGGFLEVPTWALALTWTISLAWIALLLLLGASEGKPRAAALNRAHLGLQTILLLVVGWMGLQSVLGHGPFPPGWLAAKVLLFGLIFALGIGIDFAFRPVLPAFMRLASEGSQPEIETAIGSAVNGAIRYVLALYALLLVIAFLGTTKPF